MKTLYTTLLTGFTFVAILSDAVSADQPPNIVVILADDMGWNDISLHGSKTPTPHIDGLAAAGIEFKNLVVNSVCSPTRASFYTGCDAVRNGFGGEVGDRMNPRLRTIAQIFKASGYQTGVFGKWHNGKPGSKDPWAVSPMKAGFDTFEGFHGGGTDYFSQVNKENGARNWYVNETLSADRSGYLTDLISDSAVEFIEQKSDKPLFCMVTHAAPHEPFQATDALLSRVPQSIRGNIRLTEADVRKRAEEFGRTRRMDEETWDYGGFSEAERRVVYSAMMIGLDDGVGKILKALKNSGKDKDTIVLFFSDNGAMRFIREGNLPFRETKHSLYDGGIKVPGFLVVPKLKMTAGRAYEAMIRGVDLFPTLAGFAGIPIPEAKTLDGIDHAPAILGEAKPPEVEWNGIFVYYGGYRDNRWKLIAKSGSSELYDLKQDSSESYDVSAKFPEVLLRLRARHDAWLKQHGANVNYTSPRVENGDDAQPAGEILDIRLAVSKKATIAGLSFPSGRLAGKAPSVAGPQNLVCMPGDSLIYDMKIEKMEPGQTAYITPLREGSPVFGGAKGVGIDAHGVSVTSTKGLPGPISKWQRFVIGIGNAAASSIPDFRFVVESEVQTDLHVLVDNVGILKSDGQVIPVWTGGRPLSSRVEGLSCTTVPFTSTDP